MKAEQKDVQVYPDAFYHRGWIYDGLGSSSFRIGTSWEDALRRIEHARKGK